MRTLMNARPQTMTGRLAAVAIALMLSSSLMMAQAKPETKSAKLGPGVYEVVVSESGNTVYVASVGARDQNNATIFSLDGATLEVKSKIDVSAQAAYGLSINDKTQMLYTSNTRNGNVSAIDLKTGKTVAVIADPADPKAHTFKVLVDAPNNLVYVSIASKAGKIWVIDGATNKIVHMIDSGVTTVGMAIDPASGKLYAANLGSNEIAEIDPKTRQVTRRFPVGGERPTQMVIDGKTSRIFVTNQGTNNISVLDTRTGNLIRTVPTGTQALGIGFNSTTNRLYVANRGAGTVTVVNAESYQVEADVAAGSMPNTVSVNSKTNVTYVTNKAKGGPRGGPAVEDPNGDTITLIRGK